MLYNEQNDSIGYWDTQADKFLENQDEIQNPLENPNITEINLATGQPLLSEAYLTQIGKGIVSGSAEIGRILAETPSSLYELAAFPQNLIGVTFDIESMQVKAPEALADSPVAQYYENAAEHYRQSNKQYDNTITGYIKEGDWNQALKLTGQQVAENLPFQISLLATGSAGGGLRTVLPEVAGKHWEPPGWERFKDNCINILGGKPAKKYLKMRSKELLFGGIHGDTIYSTEISTNNKLFASGGADNSVKVWKIDKKWQVVE